MTLRGRRRICGGMLSGQAAAEKPAARPAGGRSGLQLQNLSDLFRQQAGDGLVSLI